MMPFVMDIIRSHALLLVAPKRNSIFRSWNWDNNTSKSPGTSIASRKVFSYPQDPIWSLCGPTGETLPAPFHR